MTIQNNNTLNILLTTVDIELDTSLILISNVSKEAIELFKNNENSVFSSEDESSPLVEAIEQALKAIRDNQSTILEGLLKDSIIETIGSTLFSIEGVLLSIRYQIIY